MPQGLPVSAVAELHVIVDVIWGP